VAGAAADAAGGVALARSPRVLGWFERLDRERECDRIMSVSGAQPEKVFATLNLQFRLIHNRAQVLLAICGVLLSTSVVVMTGKIVGGSDLTYPSTIGRLLIAAGTAEMLAAAIVIGIVLDVRWMSQLIGDDLRGWVMTSLRYRDHKTLAYRAAIVLLLLSMVLFQFAVIASWMGPISGRQAP
jgi:hypothetical protein